MKLARLALSVVFLLLGAALAVRLILVVAGPFLLPLAALRELRASGFANARIEQAWVDLEGVHFKGIDLDGAGGAIADRALIPMSRALIGGAIGRVIVERASVAGVPRLAPPPGSGDRDWPDFTIDIRQLAWRPLPALALDLQVGVQPGPGGSARVTLGGSVRHDSDLPSFAPLQLTALLEAKGDTVAGRARLSDAGRILDVRVDGSHSFLAGTGAAAIAAAPVPLGEKRAAAALPALAAAARDRFAIAAGTAEPAVQLEWDGKSLRSAAQMDLAAVVSDTGLAPLNGTLAFLSLTPPRLAESAVFDSTTLRAIETAVAKWLGLDEADDLP